jgi:nicotinamidase-related amidase
VWPNDERTSLAVPFAYATPDAARLMSEAAHCWDDVIDQATRTIYAAYERERRIGSRPAILAVDLYNLAFEGGPLNVAELQATHPSSCGTYAWNAVRPITRLLTLARGRGIPIVYTTDDVAAHASGAVAPTRRGGARRTARDYEIRPEFAPEPDDLIIRKQRASAFFGTPLVAHLVAHGIDTVVVCGETTSGCVRASVVDAYSYGFHVAVVEECCFDRNLLSHKVNLFDLHHKYADVMHLDAIEGDLVALGQRP